MKRWAAITALAVMAVPVTWTVGAAFVAIVESWKWRPPAGEPRLVTMLTAGSSWQLGGLAAALGAAWWAGWYRLQVIEQRRFATTRAPSQLLHSNHALMFWFLGLLAFSTYSADHNFTFM